MASVSTFTTMEQNNGLLMGDMAVSSFDQTNETSLAKGEKQHTDCSDFGMLFFDYHGIPWCMHHSLFHWANANGEYTSFGVPLHAMLEGHQEYFGENFVIDQSSTSKKVKVQQPSYCHPGWSSSSRNCQWWGRPGAHHIQDPFGWCGSIHEPDDWFISAWLSKHESSWRGENEGM